MSASRHAAGIGSGLVPTLLLVFFFLGNVLTIPKAMIIVFIMIVADVKYVRRCLDFNLIAIVTFFGVYFLTSQFEADKKTEVSYQLLVAPAVLYVLGKWVGYRAKDSIFLTRVLLAVAFMLSSMPVFGVLNDINNFGFSDGGRNIAIGDSVQEVSATVLSGMLVMLISFAGVVFVAPGFLRSSDRIVIFAFCVLAAIVALRLGSRSLLAIGGGSLAIGLFLNRRKIRRRSLAVIFTVFIVFLYFLLEAFNRELEIFGYFRDRFESADYGANTAGGRLERWLKSFDLLTANPLGWDFAQNGFSHNLWLDAARNGGWPSFIGVLIISFLVRRTYVKSKRRNANDMLYQTMIACVGAGFLMLFFLEPILDGYIYVLTAFCSFWGVGQSWAMKGTENYPVSHLPECRRT